MPKHKAALRNQKELKLRPSTVFDSNSVSRNYVVFERKLNALPRKYKIHRFKWILFYLIKEHFKFKLNSTI